MRVTLEMELLELARGLIENTSRGDWSEQSREWQTTAKHWQNRYLIYLDAIYDSMMVPVEE